MYNEGKVNLPLHLTPSQLVTEGVEIKIHAFWNLLLDKDWLYGRFTMEKEPMAAS
jgi:hypothetical protein